MSPSKPRRPRPKPPRRPTSRKRPPRRIPAPPASAPRRDNPEALELARRAANLLVDRKANEVVLLDVRGMSSYADYFVLASGDTERQVTATAEHVREQLKAQGYRTIGTEGFDVRQPQHIALAGNLGLGYFEFESPLSKRKLIDHRVIDVG